MVQVVQVIHVVQVVQVVQVVRMISIDDMPSENIWFYGLNYGEKLRFHACDERTDERTDGGKWKMGQGSVRPEQNLKILSNEFALKTKKFFIFSSI